jgi:hypothetical protein
MLSTLNIHLYLHRRFSFDDIELLFIEFIKSSDNNDSMVTPSSILSSALSRLFIGGGGVFNNLGLSK